MATMMNKPIALTQVVHANPSGQCLRTERWPHEDIRCVVNEHDRELELWCTEIRRSGALKRSARIPAGGCTTAFAGLEHELDWRCFGFENRIRIRTFDSAETDGLCSEFRVPNGQVGGGATSLSSYTGGRRTWSMIVPGSFTRSKYTDLLCYDAMNGVGELYEVDAGTFVSTSAPVSRTSYRTTWSTIVPGSFVGTDFTDIYLYDASQGDWELYASKGDGRFELASSGAARKTWSIIVAGTLTRSARVGGYMELYLYDASAGEFEIYRASAAGTGDLRRVTGGPARATWTMIVPGDFTGSGHTDLLFYDRTNGLAQIYEGGGPDGDPLTLVDSIDDFGDWTSIVPGKLVASNTGTRTDLLLYQINDRDLNRPLSKYRSGANNLRTPIDAPYQGERWTKIVPGRFYDSPYTSLYFDQ